MLSFAYSTIALPSGCSLRLSTLAAICSNILYHLLDDKKVVKGILSSESGEIFLQHFRKYLIETIGKENIAVQDVPEDFLQNHIAGSFIETVRWWVNRDFKDTPEDLSSYFLKVLS